MPRRKSKPRIVRMPIGEPKPGLTHADMDLVRKSLQGTVAERSKDVYRKHFSYFEDWCLPLGVDPMEVDAEYVQTYLSNMFWNRRLSLSSVWCAASAIKKTWLWGNLVKGRAPRVSNCDWEAVLDLIHGLQKLSQHQPSKAPGLTWPRFQVVLENASKPMAGESSRKAARRAAFDIALIAVMKDLVSRREETSRLVWGDIQMRVVGTHIFGTATMPLGKTDRGGRARMGYLSIDTLAYLQQMAELCGRDSRDLAQLVFGIGDRQISNRIKAACRHVGLKGDFSGHSPRVGSASDLEASGASLVEIMHAGGWSSAEVAARYPEAEALAEGPMARFHRGLAEGRFEQLYMEEADQDENAGFWNGSFWGIEAD